MNMVATLLVATTLLTTYPTDGIILPTVEEITEETTETFIGYNEDGYIMMMDADGTIRYYDSEGTEIVYIDEYYPEEITVTENEEIPEENEIVYIDEYYPEEITVTENYEEDSYYDEEADCEYVTIDEYYPEEITVIENN